ncbi:MAG TPA: chemotaxis protein CheW [Nitrospirota bacterium]|nr:chemotaxis protein CheW [Nitrospirota bacterium]
MDILAARKKAAERARASTVKEQAAETAPAAPGVNEDLSQHGQPEQAVEALPAAAVPEDTSPAGEEAEAGPPPEPVAEEQQEQELEMLSFRLGDEHYAVMVDDVKEVLKSRDLTPVPNAPNYVLGVTALRGAVLPVIALSKRLGLPASARDEKSRILVVSVTDEDAGLIVDRVSGVVKIHPEAIRPVPETIEHGAEYLKGIARKDDKLYILLDVERALGT